MKVWAVSTAQRVSPRIAEEKEGKSASSTQFKIELLGDRCFFSQLVLLNVKCGEVGSLQESLLCNRNTLSPRFPSVNLRTCKVPSTWDLICKWRLMRHLSMLFIHATRVLRSHQGKSCSLWHFDTALIHIIFLIILGTAALSCQSASCTHVPYGSDVLYIRIQSWRHIWYLHLWKLDTVLQHGKIKPTPPPLAFFSLHDTMGVSV